MALAATEQYGLEQSTAVVRSMMVRVTYRSAIFSDRVLDEYVPEGRTLAEIVEALDMPRRYGAWLSVAIDDVKVKPEFWERVRPKAGHQVIVNIVPAGGGGDDGKNTLALIATLVIFVLAPVVGALAAAGLGAIGVGAGIAGGVGVAITGGLQIFSGVISNKLFPPPTQSLKGLSGAGGSRPQSSPTLYISGARNQINPFGVIPRPFGVNRITPPLGAKPRTMMVGDDQYLYMLFVVGYGPLALWDLKIGETPIQNFDDVEYEIKYGWPNEPDVTLFPDSPHEESLSIALNDEGDEGTRTTRPNLDQFEIEIVFPRGLIYYRSKTKLEVKSLSVSFEVYTRIAGSGAAWELKDSFTITGKKEDQKRVGKVYRMDERVAEGLEVRVVRTTPLYVDDRIHRYQDEATWGILRSIRFEDPITKSGLCEIAMKIKATDQLNGVIDQFNLIAASVLPDYGRPELTFAGGVASMVTTNRHVIAGDATRTVEGWFRFDANSEGALLAMGVDFSLQCADDGTPGNENRFALVLTGGAYTFDAAEVFDGGYHHFAAVYNSDESKAYVYVDQVEKLNEAVSDLAVDTPYFNVSYGMHGSARDVRVWTVDKRGELAQAVTGTENGLLGWFMLTEGSGGMCFDRSRTGGHGLIVDGVWQESTVLAADWDYRLTANPAAAYREVLTGTASVKPVSESRVEDTVLADWHEFCRTKPLRYNHVVDYSTTVFELLRDIAAVGRAGFSMINGKYSVIIDREQFVPRQLFTPRNSWGYSGRKEFIKAPHALRVQFVNASAGYQMDEITVYADGYNQQNATKFEQLELKGVTDADQAWSDGRYHLAQGILRPEVHRFTADWENLVCTRGDLIRFAHDVPLVGGAWGRVKARNLDGTGDYLESVDLDEVVAMEAGKSYSARIRRADGLVFVVACATTAGESTTVTFAAPIELAVGPAPSVGDLVTVGETTRETLDLVVKAIEPRENLEAVLVCEDHAPAIHLADQGTIPPFDSKISLPPVIEQGPPMPEITGVQSDEFVMVKLPNGQLAPRVLISVRRPNDSELVTQIIRTDVQQRRVGEDSWDAANFVLTPRGNYYLSAVDEGQQYDFRMRYVGANSVASDWVTIWGHHVTGKTNPPPDVDRMTVTEVATGVRRFNWEIDDTPPDFAGVEIKFRSGTGHAWADLLPLHQGLVTVSPYETSRYLNGTYTIGIKAVDTSGNRSTNALIFEQTFTKKSGGSFEIVWDGKELGWPAAPESLPETPASTGVVNDQGELEAKSASTWATLPATWDAWESWPDEIVTILSSSERGLTYITEEIDLPAARLVTPEVYIQSNEHEDYWVVEWRPSASDPWTLVYPGYTPARYGDSVQVRVLIVKTNTAVPTLKEMVIKVKSEALSEATNDLDTSALTGSYRLGVGDVRIPLRDTFDQIETVDLVFVGMGPGYTWELIDRDTTVGPRIKIYDSTGTLADVVMDTVVRGYTS